jgi:microcystin-dependent protein
MEAILGQIIPWSAAQVPRCFLACDGSILAIRQYTALFSVIGTKFGGDGEHTFALPDLRGRVVVGSGQQPGGTNFEMGAAGGAETAALTLSQTPVHGHLVYANGNAGAPAAGTGTNNLLGTPAREIKMYNAEAANTVLNQGSITTTGAGAAHENMQPFQVVNFIICAEGLYPERWD